MRKCVQWLGVLLMLFSGALTTEHYQPGTASAAGKRTYFMPLVQGPQNVGAPLYTQSYYEGTTDATIHQRQGCRARAKQAQGIIILDYGSPVQYTERQQTEYGVSLLALDIDPVSVSLSQVEQAVKDFAAGLMEPSVCKRLRIDVSETYKPNIIIAVSTSNSYIVQYRGDRRFFIPNIALGADHGKAWASMVIRINTYLLSKYAGVTAAGGYDAERKWWIFGPEVPEPGEEVVVEPQQTLDWAHGYDSVEGRLPYYFFGSMDGAFRDSSWEGRTSKLFDVYYELTRGIEAARPIPQIYSWAYAKEWYQLKRYVAINQPKKMNLVGALTGYYLGVEKEIRTWPEYPRVSIRLTPDAGWNAMYDALNRTIGYDYRLDNDLISSDVLRVALSTQITVPASATDSCTQSARIFAAEQLIPAGTCFPAGTIFPENTTVTQQFNLPRTANPKLNLVTQQYLSWSSNITYSDVP